MARSREKWEKMFGVKVANKHPDIEFVTEKGTKVKLVWCKNEYRAYFWDAVRWQEMWLGSTNPEPLKKYIMERR